MINFLVRSLVARTKLTFPTTARLTMSTRAKSNQIFNILIRLQSSASIASMGQTGAEKLNLVPDVEIDPQGRFKYVLIKVYVDDPASSQDVFKFVVRGYADCLYHGDVYDRLIQSINRIGGLDSECVGGGRILHENKKIVVFGYSQGYGPADHSKSVEILKRAYPDYNITWNNEGY